MKKSTIIILFSAVFLCMNISWVYAGTVSLSYSPSVIMQGEPFMIKVNGNTTLSSIKKITFDGKVVPVFMYQKIPTALVGVDLNKKPGVYKLNLTLSNGKVITKNVTVSLRLKITQPLGIPAKLGGDTIQSQNNMVATLVQENKTLANIKTATTSLWTKKFILPLKNILITDPYGYSRQTGAYSIPHKGVDYKASVGTSVSAINRGIVRVVHSYTDYGNTIVIDHGLGLMSFYLHLSKINVKVGDLVNQGQIIGLSGETGYTLGPHLHLSVRIGGISIDPVKFFVLFQ
jgi:murein DD-endopeptidase MepM/ murein hydrolase activator NlpD